MNSMRTVPRFHSVLVTLLLASTPAFAATTPFPGGGDSPCDATARVLRHAARQDANAEYLTAFAACINHPNDYAECLSEAWTAREEALALSGAQYQARLYVCDILGGGPYDPDLEEDEFSSNVTNTYFPLVPGRTLVYQGATNRGLERVEVTTLDETIDIDDLPCRVVRDTVTLNGELVEDTVDWFSQHQNGVVWYVGEIAQNFEDGLLSDLDGSWRAGEGGAEPGVQMLTSFPVGSAYRQEFAPGEAEDIARVLSTGETVTVPAGTFTNCLRTEEWTPLSPGGSEWKYYAPGVGLVLEFKPSSGERLELVQIVN